MHHDEEYKAQARQRVAALIGYFECLDLARQNLVLNILADLASRCLESDLLPTHEVATTLQ